MGTRFDLGINKAGIRTWMERVADGETLAERWAFHSKQEVDPILDANKAMATHNDGYVLDRSMRRVASIPLALIQHWKETEGWDAMTAGHDPDAAKKLAEKMNSSEYLYLRTAPGRISAQGGNLR